MNGGMRDSQVFPPHQSDVSAIKVIPAASLVGLDGCCVMSAPQTPVVLYGSIELIDTTLTEAKQGKKQEGVSAEMKCSR